MLAELSAYQTEDEVLLSVISTVWSIVEQSKITMGLEFELIIYNQDKASPTLQKSRYATSNCKALPAEHLIIVNERFLNEMEAAVRAFEIAGSLEACPYVRSDDDLFGLTNRISTDPYKFVSRMRMMTHHDSKKEGTIRDTIALTYLFFIGHEIGHLLKNVDARSFTKFVEDGAPLEHRLANAVVKLRRHAEEFKKFNFGLPGFERALLEGDEIERSSAALQNQIERLYLNHTQWFQDEVNADEIGTKILLEHLSAMSDDVANTCMYRSVRGVFAVALYSWYRDLHVFFLALGLDRNFNVQSMMIAMMKSREQYIRAASLFGDVHRFTLLRAQQIIASVIMTRSNVFDKDRGSMRLNGDDSPDGLEKIHQSVMRYLLLCCMMDTAVKIAYVGTSTAWLLDKDQIRGMPQLFLINFESVSKAMSRVREKIG